MEEFIVNLTGGALDNLNYFWVIFFMTIESSFIPFPSEVVMIPAAYIAMADGNMSIPMIIVCGTIGALIGALINYALAYYLGRPIVYKFANSRFGHMCLIDQEKVEKAEAYFYKNGATSTLIGRMIPAIRQLISIPAGLARMNVLHFALFTTIGAGLWNSVLALLGYLAQGQQDLIEAYSHELSIAILALLAVVVIYFIIKKLCQRQKK